MKLNCHDNERAFRVASTALLERLEVWATGPGGHLTREPGELGGDVCIALDWKFGYGDGDLATWRTGDVAELMLEWCPRKLSVTADDARSLPGSLAAFFRFMGGEGLLSAGSSPGRELAGACLALGPEYLAAMADPANWGMAKSIFAMAPPDLDLTDGAALDQFMASFNALPDEVRRQAIPDPRRPGGTVKLPPPPPLPPHEVDASRAAAPALAKFARLAGYARDGLRLTQKGNLSLADARALVPLLDTGDRVDQVIGDHSFKTKSSADLSGLHFLVAWARKAGLVKVRSGRLSATKAGLALADEPAAAFDRAVDALLDLGPLSAQRCVNQRYFKQPDVDEFIDGLTVHHLAVLYASEGPEPVEEMVDRTLEALNDRWVWRIDEEALRRRTKTDVHHVVHALELAGLARVDRPVGAPAVDRHGWPIPAWSLPEGTSVTMTPAGFAAAARLLPPAGYHVPVPRFTAATAAELLAATDSADPDDLIEEIPPRLAARSPEEAAAGLAEAAATLTDMPLRNLALGLLGQVGPEVAEPYVRPLADQAGVAPFARCWLVDHGLEPNSTLYDPADPAAFVDVLVTRIVTGTPGEPADTFALAGPPPAQIDLLSRLWRDPSPATLRVLEALGAEHPDKAVAKAARKAAFQHRSLVGRVS